MPTTKNHTGDFSDLAAAAYPTGSAANIAATQALFQSAGCNTSVPYYYGQYQAYNPYSVTFLNGHPSRLPFCGNVLPSSSISTLPLIKTINSYLPAPNFGTNATGNNFIYEAAGYNTYREVTNRYDYAVNNADHLFFRWSRGHYTLHNSTFLQNNFMGYHQDKWIDTGALGWSHVLSPKTVVDVTVGATNYNGGGFTYPSEQQLPSSLGLPTYVDQYAGQYAPISDPEHQQISAGRRYGFQQPDLSIVRGSWESERLFEERAFLESRRGMAPAACGYRRPWFDEYVVHTGHRGSTASTIRVYVQQNDGSNQAIPNSNFTSTSSGLSYASFLLGIQSQSTAAIVPQTARSNPYFAFYAGDTWRVTRKLTLVPGIRYEFEYGPTEKYNRQIVGWDPNAQLTFAPAVPGSIPR